MKSRFLRVCFGAAAMALAALMICLVAALVVSGPDAAIKTFQYGYWPLFLLALPVSAKYLK